MSTDNQSAGSATDSNAGSTEAGKEKNVVDFISFQKAVDQKKAFQAKAEQIEKERNELKAQLDALAAAKLQEQELKNKEAGEWQKVIEAKESQLSELRKQYEETRSKYEQTNKTLDDAVKLNAIYSKLPGKLKNPKYAGFIDLDKVAINPESGEVDSDTVDEVVSNFVKEHRELIDTKNFKGLPGDAATGQTTITAEAYRSKPLDEMKKSLPEAVRAEMRRRGIKN